MREPTSTSDDFQPPVPPPPALPPPAAPAPPPPPRGWGRRWLSIAASVVGALLVVVIVAGFFIRLPYVIISPGSANSLDDSVITIKGAPTYGSAGNLLYLTVRVSNRDPNLWKYLLATLDDDVDVEPRANVVGCLSDADNLRFNANLMSQSQDEATKVALERLGYAVTVTERTLVVTEVCRGAPAYDTLHVGDAIVSIGDAPIADGDAVSAAMEQFRPGDAIPVRILREGAELVVDVPTGRIVTDASSPTGRRCVAARSGTDAGDPCFGIALQTYVDYHFPVAVEFDLARVGGPSAGLSFALAIVDDLTPGDLTGGQRVAITGAIAPDGSVQPVGGVEQKAITARHQRVDLMLVPRAEVAEARRGAGDVPVVGVDTLDDALAALHRHGGTAVPPPTTTAARS